MAGFRKADTAEDVAWNGRTYRRHPEHPVWHRRSYYMATTAPRTYLHRDVYMAAHGAIPDGFHVHHVDHNPDNNHPSNLAAISPTEHASHHLSEREPITYRCQHCGDDFVSFKPTRNVRWCSARCKQAARRAAGLVPARVSTAKPPVERVCAACGTPFRTTKAWGAFCRPACRSRDLRRRRAGLESQR